MPLTEMKDLVIEAVVEQYAPHAAAKAFALLTTLVFIDVVLGNAANKYVKVKASSKSERASLNRG